MGVTIVCLLFLPQIVGLLKVSNEFPLLALLFVVAGVSISIQHIYGWILSSDSNLGVKITSASAVIMAVAITSSNLLLIPLLRIRGSVLARIFSYATSFLLLVALKKRFYRQVI